MYDPMNPPAAGIPADPLPDDLPEGDSGEVTDEGVEEPVFDPYGGQELHKADVATADSRAVEMFTNQETDDDA